jgi:hypothetical protein
MAWIDTAAAETMVWAYRAALIEIARMDFRTARDYAAETAIKALGLEREYHNLTASQLERRLAEMYAESQAK